MQVSFCVVRMCPTSSKEHLSISSRDCSGGGIMSRNKQTPNQDWSSWIHGVSLSRCCRAPERASSHRRCWLCAAKDVLVPNFTTIIVGRQSFKTASLQGLLWRWASRWPGEVQEFESWFTIHHLSSSLVHSWLLPEWSWFTLKSVALQSRARSLVYLSESFGSAQISQEQSALVRLLVEAGELDPRHLALVSRLLKLARLCPGGQCDH